MMHKNRTKSKLGRYLETAVLFGSLTATAVGGCSSSDEKQRASELGGGCSINSDCQRDYICVFERCHIPCNEDRDCEPEPLRCMKSEESEIFVCQLQDETTCEIDKDCPGDQKCGVDNECRDPCKTQDDCIGDQICAKSNECASTVESKDTLDADGNIIPDGGPAGGTGGSAGNDGSGATTPSDGGTGSGGTPTEATAGDGTGGTEPLGGRGGAGDTSQAGGPAGEGGGPNYPPAEYEELPGLAEPVDNNESEQAHPVTESANLYLSGDDVDWLSYTAPDDGRAHVLTIHIDQEPNLSGNIKIHAGADFTPIMDQNLGTGTTRDVYLTLASGATALLRFGRYAIANTHGMAFITITDVAEADVSEPNNSLDAAKDITLGQAINGQVLDPWQAANVDLSQDWFAINLAQGTYTFSFSALPTEGRLNVGYALPNSVAITSFLSPDVGALTATKNLTIDADSAGIYHFVIRPYNAAAIDGSSYNVKPKYYDEPYTFSITQ